jgi:hypothetical protein
MQRRVFLAGDAALCDDEVRRTRDRVSAALVVAGYAVVEARCIGRAQTVEDLLACADGDLEALLSCDVLATMPGYVGGWDTVEADEWGVPILDVTDLGVEVDDPWAAPLFSAPREISSHRRPWNYTGRSRYASPQTTGRRVAAFAGKAAVVSTVAAVGITVAGGVVGVAPQAASAHAFDDQVFNEVKTGSKWVCSPSQTLTATCVTADGMHLDAQAFVGPDSLSFLISYTNPSTLDKEAAILKVFTNSTALDDWIAPFLVHDGDASDTLPNLVKGSRWAMYGTDKARVKAWSAELGGGGMLPADVAEASVAMGLLPATHKTKHPIIAALALPPQVQNAVQAIIVGQAPTSGDGAIGLPIDPTPPILIPLPPPPVVVDPVPPVVIGGPGPATPPPVVVDPAPPTTDPTPPAEPTPPADPTPPPTTDPTPPADPVTTPADPLTLPVDPTPPADPATPPADSTPVDPTPDPGTGTDPTTVDPGTVYTSPIESPDGHDSVSTAPAPVADPDTPPHDDGDHDDDAQHDESDALTDPITVPSDIGTPIFDAIGR